MRTTLDVVLLIAWVISMAAVVVIGSALAGLYVLSVL